MFLFCVPQSEIEMESPQQNDTQPAGIAHVYEDNKLNWHTIYVSMYQAQEFILELLGLLFRQKLIRSKLMLICDPL